MTSTAMSRTPTSRPASATAGERLGRGLLLCGIVSSLLYIATDLIGGIRYDGYSFTSQAISELMAVGAPSERIVDPLFLAYDALVIAFAIGVFKAGSGRGRALRLTGILLVGYGAIGLTGPTLFEMHPRGASGARGDLPHIIVTAVICPAHACRDRCRGLRARQTISRLFARNVTHDDRGRRCRCFIRRQARRG